MPDEQTTGSAAAGSPDSLIKTDPAASAANSAGESGQQPTAQTSDNQKTNADGNKGEGEFDYKKGYEELESKMGAQGVELGDYRKFFKDIEPLLQKLENQPELVQAILDGKIDSKLAQSVLEGKIKPEEAEAVTKAHDEVKKEMGEEKYSKASAEEVQKLVSEQLNKFKSEIEGRMNENESLRDFAKRVESFVDKTPDFADYAADVEKWLDDHPEQDDIEVAYRVVKGLALEKKAKEAEEAQKGEDAKNLASNAAGGSSQGAAVIQDKEVVDQLIGNSQNPNVFG